MTIEHKLTDNHGLAPFSGIGETGSVKVDHRVATISASAEVDSTYTFARIPSHVRLCDLSRYFTYGSAAGTLNYKCGIFGVNGNIVDDDDALFSNRDSGIRAPSAVIRTPTTTADRGKPVWQLVNGLTKDPGGFFDIKVTLITGTASTIGTELVLSVCIAYSID